MKKYYKIIFHFLLLFFSCTLPKENKNNAVDLKNKIIGTWYLNEWDLYNKIYVQDSTHIIFDNHIDTLYVFTYQIKGDTLFLYKRHGELVNYNIIQKLTNDSLVFENLLDKQGIQKYSRVEKPKK